MPSQCLEMDTSVGCGVTYASNDARSIWGLALVLSVMLSTSRIPSWAGFHAQGVSVTNCKIFTSKV